MVRNRKTTTNRAAIDENTVARAIADLKNGNGSIRKVAERYGLSKSMLHKRIQKSDPLCIEIKSASYKYTSKYTNNQVFTNEEEGLLEEYILHCSRLQYGLSFHQIRRLSFDYATKLERQTPEPWQDNKIAGVDWMQAFMKRHPTLSLRKPENTSIARNMSFNETNVKSFFKNLIEVQTKWNFTAEQIVNVDESGISTVLQAPRIVARTGCKQVGQAVSGERGEQVTFVGIVKADGNAIPPVYIFPRVFFKESFLVGSPEDSLGLAVQSGWMNSESFVKVAQHIKKYTHASKEKPVLVLLDNHETHCSIELVVYFRQNGLVLLTFPPHTTHRLQPLDVSVFGPFKSRLRATFNTWSAKHLGKAISISDIAGLSCEPYQEAFSRKNILSGFKKSECFPLNENIFSDDEFLPASVTDILIENGTNIAEEVPPTSENKRAELEDTNCPPITPEQVRPYPKALKRGPTRRGRKKKCSSILTSTPEKDRILEERAEKERKGLLKEKPSSSEDDEQEVSYIDSDQDRDMSVEEIDPLEISPPEVIDEDDYVLVKIYGKKVPKFFVGVVIKKMVESEMEPLRFYGHSTLVNPIPGDGSKSDYELAEDSVMELGTQEILHNQSGDLTVDETDEESESENAPNIATISKAKIKKKNEAKSFLEKGASSCLR
ncbi:uncharacterized protein LOC129945153 [Eupeodes corollae]|uniref:uncharacterized protein LOC129945153 n=1 Tax=Eupeodes corollae TaxID=290404 RepID=UPI0024932C26|nr:uncharacterized protein LOC129945153 [Eupeodes corollae]